MPSTSPLLQRIDARTDDVAGALAELRERLSPRGAVVSVSSSARTLETFGEALSPQQVVERICSDVENRGLDAVLEYSEKLDKVRLTPETLRVSEEDLDAAHRAADPNFLAAVRKIAGNIREFAEAIKPQNVRVNRGDGAYLEQRFVPLARVGCCVPGGAAAYPSTVLMTVVPAQAAGVEQIAIMSPPTPSGSENPIVRATCRELGVRELYRFGGAHGVAALAYGVEGVPHVDKIVGPGNLFVALAKKRVFGDVDIDSIAGPSEVVVIVDDSTNAAFAAADLLAQAEHDPGASVLVCLSESKLLEIEAEVDRQLAGLSRGEQARQCLTRFGASILVDSPAQACEVTDLIAPEHLHIQTDDPESYLANIRNAGAVFLGAYTPVALGDYAAGPSHVLPTGGTARFAAGLSVTDFLRSHSVISYSREGLGQIADETALLAQLEGLTAHRASVDIRRS